MIPQFPQFKPLELSDRAEIEAITKQFPPYSDFNFTSLWSWNISGKTSVSRLKGDVIIQMEEYVTQKPILMFCGVDEVDRSIQTIFDFLRQQQREEIISLVPEKTIAKIRHIDTLSVEEDTMNHDYILSVDELVGLRGGKWRAKKNFINRFLRLYQGGFAAELLDLSNMTHRDSLVKTFLKWAHNGGHDESFYANEMKAFYRLLHDISSFPVHVLGVFVSGVLEGFTIFEQVDQDHVIIHFEKANIQIVGIYTFLNHTVAQKAKEMGCRYINYEQDLGIAGLANAKKAYHPVHLLEKYSIVSLAPGI